MWPFRYLPAYFVIVLAFGAGTAVGAALGGFGDASRTDDTRTVEVRIDADLIRYLDAHNCPLPEGAPHE